MFQIYGVKAVPCIEQEFHLTLEAMKDAVDGVAKHPTITYTAQPGVTSALVGQLTWLLGTAAGLAQKTLSKADVAAVFLSRKILLDRISLPGGLLTPPASFIFSPTLTHAVKICMSPQYGLEG